MFNDLPLIHATIKMRKNPIKFRCIIGSRTGVIKPAAKKLVQTLKLVMKTHRRYCDKIKFYTGIERNWIVEDNQKILQNMEKINYMKAARNIKICDLSTLYTKIPPTLGPERKTEAVTKAFKGGTNQFVRVNKKDAHWDNSKDEQTSKEQIFLLIDLVIDNSFFRFGKKGLQTENRNTYGRRSCSADGESVFILLRSCIHGKTSKTTARPRSLTTQVASLMILECWTMMEYSWKKRKRSIQWS